jgi:hypothetical protein
LTRRVAIRARYIRIRATNESLVNALLALGNGQPKNLVPSAEMHGSSSWMKFELVYKEKPRKLVSSCRATDDF